MGLFDVFSGGASESRSSSNTFVDPRQQPFLDFLNRGAQQTAQGQAGIGNTLFPLAGNLGQQGQDFLGGLGGIASGQNPFLQNLANFGLNVDEQIGQLGSDIGRNLEQNILPQIGQTGVQLGQFGSGRQGVAEGIAGQGALDAFSRGASDIRSQGLQQGIQANTAGAGLQAQAGLGGLSQLQGQFNLGLSPFLGEFSPLLQAQQIIGGPNNISSSSGSSSAFNFGIG